MNVVIENLHKSFSGKSVLTGVNLSVTNGTIHTIIGGSGSGKSVLLRHIVGLLNPDKGTISIDGITRGDAPEMVRRSLTRRIGMVFQDAALLDSLTLFDNLALPVREHRLLDEPELTLKVRKNLDVVNLAEFENHYPSQVSGGMRKRAGIARALMMDPELILYDEPTSGLDPVTSNVINHLIFKLKSELGVTSIVVSHDIVSARRWSDMISFLYEGKILFDGPPAELDTCTNPVLRQFVTGAVPGLDG